MLITLWPVKGQSDYLLTKDVDKKLDGGQVQRVTAIL